MNGINESLTPAAPTSNRVDTVDLQDQLKGLQRQLESKRKLMLSAKKKHEETMAQTSELRKTLATMEREIMNNSYEQLMDEEHKLMNKIQQINAELSSRQTSSMGSK